MTNFFLKDMLDRKTVVRYFAICVLVYTGMDYLLKINPKLLDVSFDLRLVGFMILGLFTSIYYFAKTYTASEDTLFYYQLPIKRDRVNGLFIRSLIVDTLVRKLLPVFVIAYSLKAPLNWYILILAITPIICLLGSLTSTTNVPRAYKFIVSLISLGLIGAFLYISFKRDFNIWLKVIAYIIGLFLYSLILRKLYFNCAIFSSSEKRFSKRFKIENYFLKFIFSENVYLINTVGIIFMIVIIALFLPGPMKIPLELAIATVNTPLLTIFSVDQGLSTYKKLLPQGHRSLDKDYIKVIGGYFALIHSMVLVLNYQNISAKLILSLIGFTILDTFLSFYIESHFPIKGKRTTDQIWKYPRKYIAPIVVFFISFVVFVMI